MPPIITVSPFLLEDMIVSIDGNDYAEATSTAEFVPSASVVRFKGLKKTSDHKRVTIDWACNLSFAQDWAEEESLSRYLFEHQGETIPNCILKPQSGVGPSFKADLTIVPGSIGGAVDTNAVSTVSLGSTAPVLVPTA